MPWPGGAVSISVNDMYCSVWAWLNMWAESTLWPPALTTSKFLYTSDVNPHWLLHPPGISYWRWLIWIKICYFLPPKTVVGSLSVREHDWNPELISHFSETSLLNLKLVSNPKCKLALGEGPWAVIRIKGCTSLDASRNTRKLSLRFYKNIHRYLEQLWMKEMHSSTVW